MQSRLVFVFGVGGLLLLGGGGAWGRGGGGASEDLVLSQGFYDPTNEPTDYLLSKPTDHSTPKITMRQPYIMEELVDLDGFRSSPVGFFFFFFLFSFFFFFFLILCGLSAPHTRPPNSPTDKLYNPANT